MKTKISWLLFLLCFTVIDPTTVQAELSLPEEPGTYPIETEYVEENDSTNRIFYVTVTTKNTVIQGQSAIDAKNFELLANEVKQLTSAEILKRSEAKAWSTADGSELPIDPVDFSEVEAKPGTYAVRLSSGNRVTKVLKLRVIESAEFKKRLSLADHWIFRLVITSLLIMVLLIPLGLILFASKSMTDTINQLLSIFHKNTS